MPQYRPYLAVPFQWGNWRGMAWGGASLVSCRRAPDLAISQECTSGIGISGDPQTPGNGVIRIASIACPRQGL